MICEQTPEIHYHHHHQPYMPTLDFARGRAEPHKKLFRAQGSTLKMKSKILIGFKLKQLVGMSLALHKIAS